MRYRVYEIFGEDEESIEYGDFADVYDAEKFCFHMSAAKKGSIFIVNYRDPTNAVREIHYGEERI